MKKIVFYFLLLSISASISAQSTGFRFEKSSNIETKEFKVGSLIIKEAFSPEISTGEVEAIGYFSITNTGKENDILISMKSKFADNIQVYKLNKATSKMVITAGETVQLTSEDLHIKFMSLTKKSPINEDFIVTLSFKNAGSVDVKFSIKAVAGLQTIPSLDIF